MMRLSILFLFCGWAHPLSNSSVADDGCDALWGLALLLCQEPTQCNLSFVTTFAAHYGNPCSSNPSALHTQNSLSPRRHSGRRINQYVWSSNCSYPQVPQQPSPRQEADGRVCVALQLLNWINRIGKFYVCRMGPSPGGLSLQSFGGNLWLTSTCHCSDILHPNRPSKSFLLLLIPVETCAQVG